MFRFLAYCYTWALETVSTRPYEPALCEWCRSKGLVVKVAVVDRHATTTHYLCSPCRDFLYRGSEGTQ